MNYRHIYHAGNFADVLKHAVLARLVRYLQNKDKAWRVLRARLLQLQQEKAAAELAGARKSQVGTGGRSEKIRTYNYKDNRVTDHRIGLTIKRLDAVLEGDLDDFVDGLAAAEQAERLAEAE